MREREREIYLILEPISTAMRSLHPSSPQLKKETNQKSKLPSGSFCIWKNHPTQCFRVSWPRNGVSSELVVCIFSLVFFLLQQQISQEWRHRWDPNINLFYPKTWKGGGGEGKGKGKKRKKSKFSWNPWSLNIAFFTLFPKPRSTKKAGGFGTDPFYTKTFKAAGGLENHPPTRKRYVSSLSTIAFASMMIQTPFQIERFWNLPGNIIMWVDISFPEDLA